MGRKLMDILTGAGVMGFFAGLYMLSGHVLDPPGIIVGLVDLLMGSISGATGAEAAQLWGQVKFGLMVYGVIGLLLFIGSVLYCGKRGIITAACGYFGVMLAITGLGHGVGALYLPIALLAIGLAAAKLITDRGNLKLSG